jgi:general secretion pathway protein G
MRGRGFTVVELLVVLAVMAVLLSLAAPRYVAHVDRSREVVLRQNLKTMRDAIDQFQADRGVYPTALQALVAARYLREVPVDPMTERADTWQIQPQQGATAPNFYNVRSGAKGMGSDGTAFSIW